MSRYLSTDRTTAALVVLGTVAILTVAGGGVLVAASGNAAAAHDSQANYTVVLPSEADHLPGDQNAEGASIRHSASGDAAFDDVAPEGFEMFQRLELQSDAVDFSACSTDNTAVFGVDRGNDDPGTRVDESLLDHMKDSDFYEDGLEVTFYGDSDLGGQPTDLEPEDAIMAVQGAGSSGGPCYTMPSEPGWYQISGVLEGTNAAGKTVTIEAESHYVPICEGCHDEATAEDKLGPAPSSEGDDSSTTPTPTAAPDQSTATPVPDDASTSTAEPDDGDASTPDPTDGGDDGRCRRRRRRRR
jgi:hypothetical protein